MGEGDFKEERWEKYREPWSWPGLATFRGICLRFLRLVSVALGEQCTFQFLRDCCTLSCSEAFRPIYVSLYIPLVVKEALKPERTIGLRH